MELELDGVEDDDARRLGEVHVDLDGAGERRGAEVRLHAEPIRGRDDGRGQAVGVEG